MARLSTLKCLCFILLLPLMASCMAPVPVERAPQFSNAQTPQRYEPHTFLSPFRGVPVPEDLTLQPRDTMVVENRGVRTGIASYWSRVSVASLDVFFRGELKKNGWELISAFTSDPSTTLFFEKDGFWCMVLLENRGATDVRIGVSRDNRFSN